MQKASRLTLSLALAASLVATAGCDSSLPTAPDDPGPGVTFAYFDAVVEPGGSVVTPFTLDARALVQVTLLNEIAGGNERAPLSIPLGLRLGRAESVFCRDAGATGTHAPAYFPQVYTVFDPGAYCVEVYDVGSLTETVTALIRVVYPQPAPDPKPTTYVSDSNLTIGGAAWIAFDATNRGQVRVVLERVEPSVPVGLGLGVRHGTDPNCHLTEVRTVTAGPNPVFDANVDLGTYCVQIFDVGEFTAPITSYRFTVARP